MKKTIRKGIFETNSSTTHTLVIGSKEEFDKWKNGELVWDWETEEFIPKKDAEDDGWGFRTYESFGNEFECDEGYFKSPSGDEMCWIAEYGYDG